MYPYPTETFEHGENSQPAWLPACLPSFLSLIACWRQVCPILGVKLLPNKKPNNKTFVRIKGMNMQTAQPQTAK